MNKKKIVLAIGRWMPIHLGHKKFLVDLAENYDELIIGIGSCYENGTPRNCIPAVEREKLLRKILRTEKIPNEKIKIVPIQDKETFEEWIYDVANICNQNNVTHFCTRNKEDILNVLEEKQINLNLEIINPEIGSDFPYHATDVRNAILNGEEELLNKMIPAEIKEMVINQVAKEVVAANNGTGKQFVPGRQTTDMVFIVKNKKDNNNYVLIGKRDREKIDFPNVDAIPGGGILEFESAIDAAIRVFYSETGIMIKIIDNTGEPAKIRIQSDISSDIENLNFVGIYASEDEKFNGSRGGGSQCFSIYIDGDIEEIQKSLAPKRDLSNLRFINVKDIPKMSLAFEQNSMLIDAFDQLNIDYEKEEKLAVLDENGNSTGEAVSRKEAHEKGILHGASHIYIYRINNGKIDILLQRRSHGKDSFPDCLDISSAGHMEYGMGFEETAQKELQEELGLKIAKEALQEVFTQRFSDIGEFRNKKFNNQEINKIYLLQQDIDASTLELQKEEVSEVVWQDSEEISEKIKQNDPEYCLNSEEYSKVLESIKKQK